MESMDGDLGLLLERLQLGEDTDFELKAAQGKDGLGHVPGALWETYSGMANTVGGVIILGVEDKSLRILGIRHTSKVIKALWDGLNDPHIISRNLCQVSDITTIQTEAGPIIRIQVPRATRLQRPVFVRNPIGGTYRRGHEGDYRVGDADVKRMLAEAMDDSRDSGILAGFTLEDLQSASLQAYRNLFRSTRPGHPWLALDDKEMLRMLGGWTRDRQTGKDGPSLAAVLMFGHFRALHDAVPNYLVDYQELPERGSPVRWVDRVTTDGMWSGNLFDFYRAVYPKLVRDLKVPFRMEQGHHRVDETPVHEALREALVNTLIHGDYSVSVGVLVQKRPDGFLFRNPGNLRVSLDQALEGGLSDCRNRSLQKMFQMIGEGEQAGSGFPKILSAWKGQHWQMPALEEHGEPDHIILSMSLASLVSEESLAELDARVGEDFRHMPEAARLALATALLEGEVTNDRLKTATGLHRTDLTLLLRDLTRRGFLISVGRGRGTHYHLVGGTHDLGGQQGLFDQIEDDTRSQHSEGGSQHREGGSQHSEEHKEVRDPTPAEWEGLMAKALGFRGGKRAESREQVYGLILHLTADHYLTRSQLAALLGRAETSIQNHYLRRMIKDGILVMKFQDPNHPEQAYGAGRQA
jgi:ATP-dependent DNA helicase RecG